MRSFNLKREASPLATSKVRLLQPARNRFNLKREASPLATYTNFIRRLRIQSFNLKREASPLATTKIRVSHMIKRVSISSEKPVP